MCLRFYIEDKVGVCISDSLCSLLALYKETKPHFLIFVSLLVSKPLVQCGILSMINTPFVYPTRPLYRNEATFIDFSFLRSG